MKYLFLLCLITQMIYSQEKRFNPEENTIRLLSNKDKEDYFEQYNKSYQEKENVGRDSAVWRKLSGPYGGGISALKAKGDTLLAGTGPYEALIFYSTDRGVNWLQADFKKLGQVTDFLFLPWGGALATTTTEGEGGGEGGFVYKSEDLIHWRRTKTPVGYPTPFNDDYWSLGMDSDSILYAGANSSAIVYSTDKGEIWKPGFSDIDMGRTQCFLLTDEGHLLAGTNYNILMKKKGAKPQEWVKTTYTNMPDESYTVYAISKGDSGKLYAQADYDTFVSTDNGYNWFVNPGIPKTVMYHSTFNKRFIAAFGDGLAWGGTMEGYGTAVSEDDGVTWKWSNYGIPERLDSWSTAADGEDTYLGTYCGGVFKSTDYAESWYHSSKGISAATINDFFIDSIGNIASTVWSMGVSYSTDKGKTWNLSTQGLTDPYLSAIIQDKDGIFYTSTQYCKLYKSTDSMRSWIEITQPKIVSDDFAFQLIVDNQNRLYSLNYIKGLYRTSNKGETWERLDESFTQHYVTGLSFDGKGNIYAGTFGGMIYRSNDDGKTWENLRGIAGEYYTGPFVFSDDGVIYAESNKEGVLRSKDDGKTWELIMNGITTTRISGIALNKITNELFVSSYNGSVFYSTNGGDSWINIRGNRNISYIIKMVMDKDGSVYLGTMESIWKLENIILSTDNNNNNISKEYSLSQNYPNPFNPSTTIKYSIPERSMVTIKVFDLLGREIRTLINEEKQTGSYDVTFNAEGLPSGIYFYSIHAGKFSETRKMLLVK